MASSGRRYAAARRRGPSRIRWDRVGRVGLLCVLGVIVLLYIPPTKHWIEQSRTASAQRSDLREAERENAGLVKRVRGLRSNGALEAEARRLGMVRQGERAYVIENLPR